MTPTEAHESIRCGGSAADRHRNASSSSWARSATTPSLLAQLFDLLSVQAQAVLPVVAVEFAVSAAKLDDELCQRRSGAPRSESPWTASVFCVPLQHSMPLRCTVWQIIPI